MSAFTLPLALGGAQAGLVGLGQVLGLSDERRAAELSMTQLTRQAVDASLRRSERLQREVGQITVRQAEGLGPGGQEQVSRSVEAATGDAAVDTLIINDELDARLKALEGRFENRELLAGIQTVSAGLSGFASGVQLNTALGVSNKPIAQAFGLL